MGNLSKLIVLANFLLLSAFSCEHEDAPLPEFAASECSADKKSVKTVKGEVGYIWFNSALQKYAIYTAVAGTYDSQIVGVLCAAPASFQKDGLKVKFSGKYKEFGDKPAQLPVLAGQEYYYLEVFDIQAE